MTRILIVDDKEEHLAYLQSLLSSGDCTVVFAHDGAEALAQARQWPPDLVISDLLMPVMDGYTLLHHWKADALLKKVPFIIYVDPEDERLARRMGADAVILKPADPEDFLTRVHEVEAAAAVAVPAISKEPFGEEPTSLRADHDSLIRRLEEKTLQLEVANRALREDIAGRKRAEESLRASEANMAAGQRIAHLGSWELDLTNSDVDANPLRWSDEMYRIAGYERGAVEVTNEFFFSAVPEEEHESIREAVVGAIREHGEYSITHRLIRPGGEERVVHETAQIFFDEKTGAPLKMVGITQDITERQANEQKLERTVRALTLLSAGNEVLIRAENEQALRDQICRIVVETGGYRMAWVGFAQDDEPWSIVPVAHAGVEEGYLSEIKATWHEHDPRGQGPAGQAIRAGRAVECPDFAHNPSCAPWHALAEQRGYRGVIYLPLREAAHTFGLLGLYSAEVEPTSAEELALLQKLADNLAFGILNLRARLERQRLRSAVTKVAAGVSAATGTKFFERLAHKLAEALEARAAFVSEFLPGQPPTVRTLSSVVDGQVAENFEYLLEGTPCENLTSCETFVVERNAAVQFPRALRLATLGAQAYVGQRLNDSTGRALGHLFVIFAAPLKHVQFVTSTLQIFAARAASELERRQTDVQVREQAALLDAAHEAILVKDLDDRITYWNKGSERTYGWTAAEVLGRQTRDLLYTDHARFQEAVTSVMERQAWDGEMEKHTKSGEEIVVESRWTLVCDVQGRPKSILVIGADITARKRAEAELARERETMRADLEQRVAERTEELTAATAEAERANRAKSEFLSRMSHELRTPLHAILGFAQLLELDAANAEDADSVAQIVRAGKHLLELINEVLDLARVESGKLLFTVEPVDVREILEEALPLVRPRAAKHCVRLETPAGDLDCLVLSNAQRFKQVILNLLSNAVKFNRPGGSVAISGRQSGGRLRLEVADTGRGLSATSIARLFVPFERIDEVDTVIEGSGLGLSLSKHLIEAMGGQIGVESTPGEGSLFWVELPLAEGKPAAGERSLNPRLPRAAKTTRSTAPRTLLYIEDNLSNLRLVERILARRPEVKLISAIQGSLGLELARRHRPDLVLLDLHLPDIQGDEILRRLRSDPTTADIPVVMISADATPAQAARLRADGAHDYLTKPIDMRQFLALVDATPARTPPPHPA